MPYGYLRKGGVSGQVFRLEQDFQVHHVVDDNLLLLRKALLRGISRRTSKTGSGESQLRVQPTMGLKRPARSLANALTASIAVEFSGFLRTRVRYGRNRARGRTRRFRPRKDSSRIQRHDPRCFWPQGGREDQLKLFRGRASRCHQDRNDSGH